MDAQAFWNVIGMYNSQTVVFQIILALFLVAALVLSYTGKNRWVAKLALGIANLFIGIVFFQIFGTEPIQKFFALPLYLICGCLFIFESIKNKTDVLQKPNKWHIILLSLYVLYPFVSFTLGNTFPQLVTYIMPCPVISLSIAVYSGYQKKNMVLLLLLTIWGLTGIKSLIFSAYEDVILLICGVYGIYLIYKEIKARRIKPSH